MASNGVRVLSVLNTASEQVHRTIDRPEVSIVCVFIFSRNEIEGPCFRTLFEKIRSKVRKPDVDEEPEDQPKDKGLRVVVIGG